MLGNFPYCSFNSVLQSCQVTSVNRLPPFMCICVLCVCMFACTLVYVEVDISSFPWLLFDFILWGRVSLSNLELTDVEVEVDTRNFPWLSFSFILWGRVSRSNLELTDTASLASRLTPGTPSLCLLRLELITGQLFGPPGIYTCSGDLQPQILLLAW